MFIPVITSAMPDSAERLTSPVTILNITFSMSGSTLHRSSTLNYLIQQIPGSIQFRGLEYAEANGHGGVTVLLPTDSSPGNIYRIREAQVATSLATPCPAPLLTSGSPTGRVRSPDRVLDSLNPGSAGLRQPVVPADLQGTDSVIVSSVAGRVLGYVTPNTGSTAIRVVWDTAAASWHVRVPADTLAPLGQTAFVKAGTLLRAHVFGDASGTRLRFAVRDAAGDREVSGWIVCDWVGWRALTWDLEVDPGTGTGNGVLDGSLRFDGLRIRLCARESHEGHCYQCRSDAIDRPHGHGDRRRSNGRS